MTPSSNSKYTARYRLLIKDIPAFVCKQCGEPYFGEEEVEAVQDIRYGQKDFIYTSYGIKCLRR